MEPTARQRGNVSTWMSLGRRGHASRHPARRANSSGRKELSLAKCIHTLSSVPGAMNGCLRAVPATAEVDCARRRSSRRMTGERDQAVLGVEALAALAPPAYREAGLRSDHPASRPFVPRKACYAHPGQQRSLVRLPAGRPEVLGSR